MSESDDGLRQRLARQGEDALGRLVEEVLDNPVISGAFARALGAREKAAQAQEVAMGALNLPSASDLERLTRRVRSVSQRLEGVEDALDRLERQLEDAARRVPQPPSPPVERRLEALERQLAAVAEDIEAVRVAVHPASAEPAPGAQERLEVERSS
jgi:seryl-tRNA synthetase